MQLPSAGVLGRRKQIAGTRALVTGAGRGIGLATAVGLARSGAAVEVVELDQELAEAGATAVREAGGTAGAHVLDVRDAERFAALADVIERERGPIDILINNAGLMTVGSFLEQGRAEDERQLAVNLRGVANGMRAVLPRMVDRGRGHVVNIASVAGRVGAPHAAMYSASKFASIGLTEAVRAEHLGTGVDFTYVMPAFVQTDLVAGTTRPVWPPPVQPEDVAAAVLRAIERRQVEVYVPRIARISTLLPVILPRGMLDLLGRKLGMLDMFARVDRGRRADYLARTSVDYTESD
jgi:short-subunit dehydrogenase